MMFKKMKDKLKNVGIAPIFFVGSGISRRYINSPDWNGLLKEIVKDREINFMKLQQKYTESNGIVSNEKLAQELEDVYFDRLKDSEIENGGSKPYYFRKKIADLIDTYLQESKETIEQDSEIIALRKTRPAAIITTNYDKLMETIFGDEYSVLIGQDSLLESVVDGVGEIYKIHGCSSSPNSIVITEKDYDNFFNKSRYLNAKLLTLFLEYPIVFLGYSVSDRNIINTLSTIIEMLSADKVEELKSRIWFVERSKSGKDEKGIARINLDNGHYLDIDSFKLVDYGKLYNAISDISIKRIPMKFLKYLKSNTYELIASQEYNPKLLNVNIEDIEKIDNFDDVNQFVGLTFSTQRKMGFFDNENICNSFLSEDDNQKYDEKDLLKFRGNNKVPFYKFLISLSKEQILDIIGNKDNEFYKQVQNDKFLYSMNIGKKQEVDYKGNIIKQDIEKYSQDFVVKNNLQPNQKSTVIRYVLLQLISQDIDQIINEEFIIQDYRDEVVKVMTHLPIEVIKKGEKDIFRLLKALSIGVVSTHNFRYLLCYIDRALYGK